MSFSIRSSDKRQNHNICDLLETASGELFLIELYNDQPKIYGLNMEEKVWIQVKSLGDRIFFAASDCSFSLSAQKFPEGKSNCIYFRRRRKSIG
ncbi:hypothetical protein H5410_008465 [Solanum commersonii]|uniref:KIB1-4 beta-propeller domain-containing protein n=1 Tax=Solanum commersonii TaxID=4109 RepID=A0A9J6AGV1_SOLCO|nr:hypothetical protein H5410_008465 [Solanum commersonii]